MVDLGTSLDELHVMKVRVFLHKREREEVLLNRSTDQANIVNKKI